jgi:CRP/FNR family cyclic AMP-dependent transcriptional regulator
MPEKDSSIFDQIAEQHALSQGRWQQLLSQAHQRDCSAGEVLFDEGDFNPNLYLLAEGRVDLAMKVTGRGWVKILSLSGGDIIAWSAMLGSGRMTCRATCMTSCRLIYWPHEKLEAVCRADTEFGYTWMKFLATALSSRLLATRLQLLDLFSADERGRQ